MAYRKSTARTVLPFGLDYSDVLSSTNDIEKPKIILPINAPLSAKEENEAIQSINFTKIVLDGPFYTGSTLDSQQNTTSLTFSDGINRYSDKYKKVKTIGTTIDEHPFNLEFFPNELYSVMGVTNNKRKKLGLSSYKANGNMKHFKVDVKQEPDEDAKLLADKLRDLAEDLDKKEEDVKDIDEDEDEDDDEHDEFEDDEDDDYNAEKYFDDGNEDYGNNDEDGEAEF